MVEQERHEEGIAQIQEGLATARARGAALITVAAASPPTCSPASASTNISRARTRAVR